MVNFTLSLLTSFCVGLMFITPPLSFLKAEALRYSHVPEVALFPKHPIVECVRDAECSILAEASYYEGRGESDAGVLLIMQTIQNRVEHDRWGESVEEVVYAPKQFSYTHDGSLNSARHDTKQWARMYFLAYQFMKGKVETPKEWQRVTHYHSKKVKPSWSKYYEVVAVVGNHVAYECKEKC